ncbi:MAG: hypothetical protein ACNA7G_01905 [Methylobacter sp.]
MTSRTYQPVLKRQQEMLLPPCVDEYVSRNNPVRAIDAYVDTLDLQALGFKNRQPVKCLNSSVNLFRPLNYLVLALI